MSVTVKQITDMCIKNKDLDTLIKEQLQIIDDKLIHSDRSWGNNCITHSLPTTIIGITGLDKTDAQRIIYSTIICSLKKRGFTVKIVLDDSSTILYVSWKSELNDSSLETMNTIIRDNRINKQELHELLYKS
jgi:hypothetical protein